MKLFFFKKTFLLVLLAIYFLAPEAQSQESSGNFTGQDLRKLEERLTKELRSGRTQNTITMAEVLFYQGKHRRAFGYYNRANSLGQIATARQKRNFVHSGRAVGQETPFDIETGYFNKEMEVDVTISNFCGNSPNEDIVPYQWNEYLFLTTSRDVKDANYPVTRKPYLKVVAFGEGCRPIPLPSFLPPKLNTPLHDGPIAISADANLVIINRNFTKESKQGYRHLLLDYYVKSFDGEWQGPIMIPFCNPSYSVQHPFFCDRDQVLYFSSDMPGGFGGFDLYKSHWNGKSWGSPENLGEEINTIYDEVFPVITPDGLLSYSSNHIETYGGLDLVLFKDGQRFLFPKLLNSNVDDFGLTFSNKTNGYFASTRDRGSFRDNILIFNIKEPHISNILLIVKDNTTGLEIDEVLVKFEISQSGQSGQLITNKDGSGSIHIQSLWPQESISFDLIKMGYESKVVLYSSSDLFEKDGNFLAEVYLEPEEPLMNIVQTHKPPTLTAIADPHFIQKAHPDEAHAERETAIPLTKTNIEQQPEKSIQINKEPITTEQLAKLPPVQLPIPPDGGKTFTQQSFQTGVFDVFFENNMPLPDSYIMPYDASFQNFMNARPQYYYYSASVWDEMDQFFNEVREGMLTLEAFAKYIKNNIQEGVIDIFLRGFTSPLANPQYNKMLSERRNTSIIHYLENWNEGVLRPLIENGNINMSSIPLGDSWAPSNVSDSMEDRSRSVYSVEASRERRTTVFWVWSNQPPRPRQVGQNRLITSLEAPQLQHSQAQQKSTNVQYFIIVGSSTNRNEAERTLMSIQNRGYKEAGIISAQGRFRVYVKKFADIINAEKEISFFRQNIVPDAWLFTY